MSRDVELGGDIEYNKLYDSDLNIKLPSGESVSVTIDNSEYEILNKGKDDIYITINKRFKALEIPIDFKINPNRS